MKKLLSTVAMLALSVAALGAQGQSTPPPQKPEEKKETKPAPSPAGKWDVSAQTQQGAMASTLDLKVDGKKVTGVMASQMGETPLTGEFADGKLRFSISFPSNNGNVEIVFNGAFKEDGSLAGTFDYGQGAMTWTATRAKG
jgi:hypothetical protein